MVSTAGKVGHNRRKDNTLVTGALNSNTTFVVTITFSLSLMGDRGTMVHLGSEMTLFVMSLRVCRLAGGPMEPDWNASGFLRFSIPIDYLVVRKLKAKVPHKHSNLQIPT